MGLTTITLINRGYLERLHTLPRALTHAILISCDVAQNYFRRKFVFFERQELFSKKNSAIPLPSSEHMKFDLLNWVFITQHNLTGTNKIREEYSFRNFTKMCTPLKLSLSDIYLVYIMMKNM